MKRTLLLALTMFGCGRPLVIDSPDPVEQRPQQQPLRGCDGQSVVSLLDRRTLTRLSTAGATALFKFGEGSPDDDVYVQQWNVTSSGFVGGFAFVGSGEKDYAYEVVLIAPDGKVRHTRRLKIPHSPTVFLGEDGSLTVAASTGLIIRPDGSVTDLGELMPMTPVLAGGEVVVAQGMPWEDSSPKGVWKDGVVTPVTLSHYPELQVVGGKALTVTGNRLVQVPEGTALTLPKAGLRLAGHTSGRFVLLIGAENDGYVADLSLGTVKPLTNVPAATERFGAWNTALQSDGAVLAVQPNGELLQARRTTDFGATWSNVGEPMTKGMDFGLGAGLLMLESRGSVLAVSMSQGYGAYVHEVQLASAKGAHRLVTGTIYVNGDLSPGAADLAPDGQCAAAWVQEREDKPAKLMFLAVDGTVRDVHTASSPGWFRFMP